MNKQAIVRLSKISLVVLSIISVLTLTLMASFSQATTYSTSNSTTLTFVATTTPQAHFLTIVNSSVLQSANLTITYSSLSLGGWDIYLNGFFIGNVTGTDTSPKNFSVGILQNLTTNNNITYVPEVATTGTIDSLNIGYVDSTSYPINITPVLTPNGTTSNSSVIISYNVSNGQMNSSKFSWDGINYSLYDNFLVLFYNFDNRSSLGENDSRVVDISRYSNNGTIIGGSNISWTSNGYFNGAYNFSGKANFINITSENVLENNPSQTICIWFKPDKFGNFAGLVGDRYSSADDNYTQITIRSTNATESSCKKNTVAVQIATDSGFRVSNRTWYNICSTFNSTGIRQYVNGVFDKAVSGDCSNISNTVAPRIGSYFDDASTDRRFNGSIDSLIIFNRTLSANEIYTLYNSQLTKYDINNWTFYSNQTLNYSTSKINSSSLTYANNYYLCSSNSTSDICSSSQTITQTIVNKNISALFSNSVGNVRTDFYGMNIQTPNRIVGVLALDLTCDGVDDSNLDTTWSKTTILNSRMNYNRYDISLGSYYSGVNNLGFEEWQNTSVGFLNSTGSPHTAGTRGWSISSASNANVTVYRTTDVHSGNYALQVNSSGGTGGSYVWRTQSFKQGDIYNFSIWLKGSGSVILAIKNSSNTAYQSSSSITLTSSFVQYSTTYNVTEASQTFYIMVDDLKTWENVTMDDFVVTVNGVQNNWWQTGNDTSYKEAIQWNYDNSQRMLLILDYMPTFLANWSDPNCEGYSGNSTGDSTCMPYSWDIWKNITENTVSRFTNSNISLQSIIDIEIWNEPYGNLGNYSYDSIPLALAYVQLANHSYNAIKGYNPNMKVFIPSGFQMTTTPNIFNTVFSNLSGRFDGITTHPYAGSYKTSNNMYNYLTNITNTCISLGGGDGCNRIIASEWETYNERNISNGQSDDFKSELAMAYQSVLNWNPSNTSMQLYHYLDTTSYFSCSSLYPEYPAFFSAVSPAGLDNSTPTYYPPYNITKNFATYCPSGGIVYNSSSDDSTIKTVTCRDRAVYNIIVINTDTSSKNLTINNINSSILNLTDINGNVYPVVSNSVSLGILDGYGISYLTYGVNLPAGNGNTNSGGTTTVDTNSTTLQTQYANKICIDTKTFLSSQAKEGNQFSEIPIGETKNFITQTASKYGLPESIISMFVYSYNSKCNDEYPVPPWTWLKSHGLAILIVCGIGLIVLQTIRRM